MNLNLPSGGLAVVVGARGGIGRQLLSRIRDDAGFDHVLGLCRGDEPFVDLCSEPTIEAAAAHAVSLGAPLRLLVNAAGFLHDESFKPERSWRQFDAGHMAQAFAVNTIGPALLMKHFLPLLPRQGKAVVAMLSAKVGSIGDNRLGGWHSYRASKAALNQLVRTTAVELARTHPEAVCVALHPGTVDTRLSAPFAKTGLAVQQPDAAAERLLATIGALDATSTGGFFNQHGVPIPW